jgi:hypothetical protein
MCVYVPGGGRWPTMYREMGMTYWLERRRAELQALK